MKKRLPQIRERLTDNGAYKLVALFVAVVIWVTLVSSRKDVVLTKDLSVDFLARANVNVEMLDETNTLRLKLAGPRNLLRRFNESTFRISVDVTRYDRGEYKLRVDERLLNLPLGVKMLSAKPDVLRFKMVAEEVQK